MGMELRDLKLKSKLLTCSQSFTEKYDLEPAEPCSNGQSCLRKPPAKLSLILETDLHFVQPKLIEQFSDIHGFMAVYACSLSQKLITAGNRMYPYTEETARIALSTNSFGGATDIISHLEEDNLSKLPSTSLFHSALQGTCPTAVRIMAKGQVLQFPEDSMGPMGKPPIGAPMHPTSSAASS
jgi:hypothetical protein